MMTGTLSLNEMGKGSNPITHLNSTKEFFMLASPILKELSASQLSSTAKSLWKVLLDLSKKTSTLTCSYARVTLAKMINRSVRTVTSLVAELEEHGFLHVIRGYASPTMKKVNVYQVTVPHDLIEQALQAPNRKRKTQTQQRSDAMERLSSTQNDLAAAPHRTGHYRTNPPSAYSPPTHEEYGLNQEMGSAENCTIDKKEDLNNNNSNSNNLTETTNSISVPFSILSEINSVVNEQDSKVLTTIDTTKHEADITKSNLQQGITGMCQKIGDARKELEYVKQNQSENSEKITMLIIKERILCEERDQMLDFKKFIDKMMENQPFLYMISILIKKYEEYKMFYREKKRISASRISYFENGKNESEYEQVEQAEAMCLTMLGEIKADISRQQINAKLAYFLKDPCFVGHDLRVHDPRIPKNILSRYFELVKEVVTGDKAYEIINEMAASVRFGELSRCKDEEGKISFVKGFNVALKLLREGRWQTPKCVSVVLEMIPYSELNVNIRGISLFKDVNCQLESMGFS